MDIVSSAAPWREGGFKFAPWSSSVGDVGEGRRCRAELSRKMTAFADSLSQVQVGRHALASRRAAAAQDPVGTCRQASAAHGAGDPGCRAVDTDGCAQACFRPRHRDRDVCHGRSVAGRALLRGGMPRRVRAPWVCLVLVLCWLAPSVPARDPGDGVGVCSGGACAGCKTMGNEVGKGGEWEDFLEGFRAPRVGAPAAMLEVGSGEGLTGLWFLSRVNASTLTSVDAWRDAATESCFDANRCALGIVRPRRTCTHMHARARPTDVLACADTHARRRQAVQEGGIDSASWSKRKQDEKEVVLSFLENRRVFDIM